MTKGTRVPQPEPLFELGELEPPAFPEGADATDSDPTCTIDGCDKPLQTRGWCQMHYARWRKHGDLRVGKPRKSPYCEIDGCDRPTRALGMCMKHYNKAKWKQRRDSGEPCSVDGCEHAVLAKDLCSAHYQRQRMTGEIGEDPVKVYNPGPCYLDYCDRKASAYGLCQAHRWQQVRGRPLSPLERQISLTDRDSEGRKYCGACQAWKVLDDFGDSKSHPDGRCHKCRRCTRDANLRTNFKMSLEQYEEMIREQGGGCAICGGQNQDGSRLAVDHDHACCKQRPGNSPRTCGQCTRGILCRSCNWILGKAQDNPETLRAAADYLDNYVREKEGSEWESSTSGPGD